MPITITHAKSNAAADYTGVVTLNNQSGGTTTAQGTDLIRPSDWNSGHQFTLQLTGTEIASLFTAGNGLSISTGTGGVTFGEATSPFFEPFPLHNTNSTLSAPGIGTWYLDGPYAGENGVASGMINVFVSNAAGFLNGAAYSAASTGSVSKYQTFYDMLCMYKQGAGAQSTRLESAYSNLVSIKATWIIAVSSSATNAVYVTNQLSLSYPYNYDTLGGVTYTTTSQSSSRSTGVSTVASSFADSFINTAVAYVSGARMDVIPVATSAPAGAYWLAHCFYSTSSTAGTGYGAGVMMSTHSRLGLLENVMNAYKRIGASVSNSTSTPLAFHGYLATSTSLPTSVINTSDIRATTGRMYWNYFLTSY